MTFRLIALFFEAVVFGQAQDARPAYEVASIKPNTSGMNGINVHGDQAQITISGDLKSLIEDAYNIQPFQVAGPGWMANVAFDISAKYPPDVKRQEEPLMLRTLLEERLKLAVHRESKQMQGYELVVARGGFKLKPVEPGDGGLSHRGGFVHTVTAHKLSMAALADRMSRWAGQKVIDGTGLTGVYDFDLRWRDDVQTAPNADADDAPSLSTALQETLGLRLQPQKVPVEMIVVDHVERVPSEN